MQKKRLSASLTLFTGIFQFVYLYSKIPVKIFRDTGNSIFRMLKGEIAEFRNIKSLKIYIRNYYSTKKSPLKGWEGPPPPIGFEFLDRTCSFRWYLRTKIKLLIALRYPIAKPRDSENLRQTIRQL